MTGLKNIIKGVATALSNVFKYDQWGYLKTSFYQFLEILDSTITSPIEIGSGSEVGLNNVNNESDIYVYGTLRIYGNLTFSANSSLYVAPNATVEFVR